MYSSMRLPINLLLLLLVITFSTSTTARKQPERVLLSNIKSLTLRKGFKTTHQRVTPIPQLKCVGGTAKDLYDIDVMRCKNAGSSYDEADVEWTCTASLPSEFKLGSTDVICEGFTGPDDPHILKGSCGVEYRLMLSELGEEKYGRRGNSLWEDYGSRTKAGDFAAVIFWMAFIAVVVWMIYSAFFRDRARRPGNRFGFSGFGGGGDDDPPPPYDYHPLPSKHRTFTSSSRAARAQQEGWRPGFWTGALGGAAAGYLAGNRGNRTQQEQPQLRYQDMWGNGEGSSSWGLGRTRSSGSSGSSSGYGSNRHESTGFGGTTRR